MDKYSRDGLNPAVQLRTSKVRARRAFDNHLGVNASSNRIPNRLCNADKRACVSRKTKPEYNIPVKGSLCHWRVVVQRFDLLQNICHSGGERGIRSMTYEGQLRFTHSGRQNVGIKNTLPYLLARMVLHFLLLPLHLLRNGFCPPSP